MLTLEIQRGFTLIELMVVVAIGAILTSLAIPSFSTFINSARQKSVLSQLSSDLNFARNEAIKRNTRTLICIRNAAGTGCAGAGTDWSVGWLVCADENADAACDGSTAIIPNPLKVQAALDSNLRLEVSAATIRFNANGSQGVGTSATLNLGGKWPEAKTRTFSIAPSGSISKR